MTRAMTQRLTRGGQQNKETASCDIRASAVVIGIGSPYGDDAAGWQVIDRLAEQWPVSDGPARESVFLHKASVPHDVLDWLNQPIPAHIVDASEDDVPAVRRFSVEPRDHAPLRVEHSDGHRADMAEVAFPNVRSQSTHQFDLMNVLQLASALGRLAGPLALWTVSIECVDRKAGLTSSTAARVDTCAERIGRELRRA